MVHETTPTDNRTSRELFLHMPRNNALAIVFTSLLAITMKHPTKAIYARKGLFWFRV